MLEKEPALPNGFLLGHSRDRYNPESHTILMLVLKVSAMVTDVVYETDGKQLSSEPKHHELALIMQMLSESQSQGYTELL